MPTLKNFYKDVRRRIQAANPDAYFVFHDMFHFSGDDWNDMFDDWTNVAMDTHYYQAWWSASSLDDFKGGYDNSLGWSHTIDAEVWVGEWSLATDVCAMWLGGFNDNNTPYSYECNWVECPYSYLPEETATDFDRTAETLGPFGSNKLSVVNYGKCPSDSLHFNDDEVDQIAKAALDAFDRNVGAQFMWTFRNELEDRWSYNKSFEKGWINRNANKSFLQ